VKVGFFDREPVFSLAVSNPNDETGSLRAALRVYGHRQPLDPSLF
jgi:hypothetical protein